MIIEKLTQSAQGRVEAACRQAVKQDHQYVTVWHLLEAILSDQGAESVSLLKRLGPDMVLLKARIDGQLLTHPKAKAGSQQTPVSRDLERVFIHADELAAQCHSPKITMAHLMVATTSDANVLQAFKDAGVSTDAVDALVASGSGAESDAFAASDSVAGEALAIYTTDITALAQKGDMDPVIGREREVALAVQILGRRLKNNPIVIGEPGVGKTALVEGLAQRIVRGEVPEDMKGARILSLDMGQMVAGAKFRGEFEERFKSVLAEVIAAGNVILFIDEIHMLVGAGGSEGSMDAANLMKPALSRGEIRCIGSTTLSEYRKHIETDTALMRRFQIVQVDEPSVEEAVDILRGVKGRYEEHHGVRFLDAALQASARLSARYITDRFLPDKAVDLMDQTASSVRIALAARPADIRDLESREKELSLKIQGLAHEEEAERVAEREALVHEHGQVKGSLEEKLTTWQKNRMALQEISQVKNALAEAENEMAEKIKTEDFARVAELQHKVIPSLSERVEALGEMATESEDGRRGVIGEDEIADTVSRVTGIPVSKMMEAERERLLNLEGWLSQRVVGQDDSISAIAKAIRRSRAGVQNPGRPIASFLMLGPTGVGKTEIAKTLASYLFDDETALTRIDMSEFMEKHTVARLVGAPPGYVGYEEGGVLTNSVRRKPYSVILFDEVEKAHGDVFNLFLQLLDDGRLTDSQGNTVSFANTIVLMTSNLGAENIQPVETDEEQAAMNQGIMDAVRNFFRPEFLNRLDDILVFRQLSHDNMVPIAEIQLGRLKKLLAEQNIDLEVDDSAKAFLAERGFNPLMGARPLARVIQTLVQDPLAEGILDGTFQPGGNLWLREEEGEILIVPKDDTSGMKTGSI
ncbi:MAG: AAA family ATPase [Desulfobacterales bacterium]|nr:AAA family ATPase [Desulfobacterales bacterium]